MPAEIININEEEKWDNIVKSFREYDVNYLNGYSKAFKSQGTEEPLLFYYYDSKGTKAINVIMKQDIALTQGFIGKLPVNSWFDITTPYGYGGFLVEGSDFQSVTKAFRDYCKSSGIVSEFVRFHLLNNSHLEYDGIYETRTKNIIRNLNLSLDEMIMDFEHKVRKSLKKAARENLTIEIDSTGERLSEFLDIYYGTMERNSANEKFFFTKKFFELINQMENHYIYIHVLLDGKVISSELILYGPKNCYSFLGGTDRNFLKLQPNTLLKYEVIKWARSNNLENYILGGGYGDDDGIYKYKKSFAPNGICDFYIGKKIIDKEMYDKLILMTKKQDLSETHSDFFPEYRVKL